MSAPKAPNEYGMPNFIVQTDEKKAIDYLTAAKFPFGLADTLVRNLESKIVMRYFLCDDSGSMYVAGTIFPSTVILFDAFLLYDASCGK